MVQELAIRTDPFHILSGINRNITFGNILCFYLILAASCILFYSYALLFGIFGGSVFNGFKPWLGSGIVFLFLLMSIVTFGSNSNYPNYAAFATLFSPTNITGYFFPDLFNSRTSGLQKLQFFNFAVGQSLIGVIALHLSNYALWTYWAWQGLKRCFRNPNATIFSKQQSYFIFVCFEVVLIGFFISEHYLTSEYRSSWEQFYSAMGVLYVWNLFLIVPLFALMLPHRQAIQDWARFRFNKNENSTDYSNNSLFSEFLSGEKSPAILAMAVNLSIAISGFFVLYFKANIDSSDNSFNITKFLSTLLLFISLIMIYSTVAQIMLMLRNSKRTLWVMGTTSAVIILPIIIFGILDVQPQNILSLFTIGFWFFAQKSTLPNILITFVCQVLIAGLLNWYLIKQVKSAGESATKALFSQAKV